jgi:hypothetical protein
MKTTLVLPDPLVAQLKREALNEGRSMSEVVADALRAFFQSRKGPKRRVKIPTYDMGEILIDICDRRTLHEKLGGRWM